MLKLFDSLVKPILLYGSYVWGVNQVNHGPLDKLFLWYAKLCLGIKSSTSNTIVYGECGRIPISAHCQINAMKFYFRLKQLSDNNLTKYVYNELSRLDALGFTTWVSKARCLARKFDLEIDCDNMKIVKDICTSRIKHKFIDSWHEAVQNIEANPIMRTYKLFKTSFEEEKYLSCIKNYAYMNALCKIRTSSHTLPIEQGRWSGTVREERLCNKCNIIGDEYHFITSCSINENERSEFYRKLSEVFKRQQYINSTDMYIFLLTCDNPHILSLLGKFLYKSLKTYREHAS